MGITLSRKRKWVSFSREYAKTAKEAKKAFKHRGIKRAKIVGTTRVGGFTEVYFIQKRR